MKILYIAYRELDFGVGVSKKIVAQNQAFIDNGCTSDIYYYTTMADGNMISNINDSIYEEYGKGLIGKLKRRFCRKNVAEYIINNNVALVYIRYEYFADYTFLLLLKKIKQCNVPVILEIPTYPYDGELRGSFLHTIIEKIYRMRMHHYVQRIVTYSDSDLIFRIPTIKIANGVDFRMIPVRKNRNVISQRVVFIGVANLAYWHGYDRFIKGMYDYLKNGNLAVYFHVVGDGNKEYQDDLKQLVKKLSLDAFVLFHGNTEGDTLTNLFEISNMAVGSLGRHRSGICNLKTLKNVEYAARGIPFIYSECDNNFDDKPYVMKVPADETPIDVEKVISFYLSQEWDGKSIRQSVENGLSWKDQMEKVLNDINLIQSSGC